MYSVAAEPQRVQYALQSPSSGARFAGVGALNGTWHGRWGFQLCRDAASRWQAQSTMSMPRSATPITSVQMLHGSRPTARHPQCAAQVGRHRSMVSFDLGQHDGGTSNLSRFGSGVMGVAGRIPTRETTTSRRHIATGAAARRRRSSRGKPPYRQCVLAST